MRPSSSTSPSITTPSITTRPVASQPIATLSGGMTARVRGVARRAQGELLTSRLGGRPCVYWDVRHGLDAEPYEREAADFWLEDETGRVLVRGDHLAVEVLADRQRQVIRAADADHAALSERLSVLKTKLRSAGGEQAAEIARERARLAKIVTLLLAVRAHARGRVHVGGSLPAQDEWIRENAGTAESSRSVKSIELVTERWEVVIAEGQEVEVEGLVRVERAPSSLGLSGGYRDLPTCLVLTRGAEGAPVTVRGLGASAPARAHSEETNGAKASERARARRGAPPAGPGGDPRFERMVMITMAVVAAVSALVWLLR